MSRCNHIIRILRVISSLLTIVTEFIAKNAVHGVNFLNYSTEYIMFILLFLKRTHVIVFHKLQGGSNMTETYLYVNKPHCAAAVRP